MPIRPRCLITAFVNSNCTAFVASFQRTSTSKFHWAQFSPFPLSFRRSLFNICALLQIFYCFLCTSQNSLSLAKHNCAPVKVSSYWLLRFRALVVNFSIWVTCHMHGVATFKGTCLSKGRLFTDWYRYRLQSHCIVSDAEKFWFIESVWKPDQLFEFPASKETGSGKQRKFRRNIAEVKKTRMFSVMADEAADVSNKENLLCPPPCRLLKKTLERSLLISAIVEKKQPVTHSRS